MNVTGPIAEVVRKRLATLAELDNLYGVSDLYTLLEIGQVDDYNTALARSE